MVTPLCTSSGQVKLSEKAFWGTVYRGVSFTPEVAALYKPGVHITEKAFTSTTPNAAEKIAGNTLFHITSKSVRMIDEISHFSKEAEVLFAPVTVFKVLRNTVQTINGKQVNLIVMEQVVGR